MRMMAAAAALVVVMPVLAGEVHRCEIDGQTVYQATPCPGEVEAAPPTSPPRPAAPAAPSGNTAGAAEPGTRSWQDFCDKTSELAEVIMQRRQNGHPMREAMGSAPTELIKRMVIAAYDSPRFSTSQHQRRAISEFANKSYLTCIQAGD